MSSYLAQFTLQTLTSLGVAALIAIGSWAVGRRLIRRLGDVDGPGGAAAALALGLGVLGTGAMGLGFVRLLRAPVVGAAFIVVQLACWREWRELAAGQAAVRAALRKPARLAWAALIALVAAPLVLLALYPPIGFDATLYHLPMARAFVETGALVQTPDLRFPVFPQLGETLYAVCLLFADARAAQLVHLLAALTTAALLLGWGGGISRRAGLPAAAIWLGSPLVAWISGQAYVDLLVTLWATVAVWAWQRRDGPGGWGWLAVAGACAGFAAGAKYLGLPFLALALGATVWHGLRLGRRRAALAVAAATLAAAAPWYARTTMLTGNPVFPFLPGVFGSSDWLTLRDQERPTQAEGGLAARALRTGRVEASRIFRGVGDLAALPAKAVSEWRKGNWGPPPSPFYLVLIPVGLVGALRQRPARQLLAVGGAYGLCWLITPGEPRLMLPAVPIVTVALLAGLAASWDRLASTMNRSVARAAPLLLAVTLVSPGVAWALYRVHILGAPPALAEQHEMFLARNVPGFAAVARLNREHGSRYAVYALFGERLHYFAAGRLLGDWIGPYRFSRALTWLSDGAKLAAVLRSMGADHLLVVYARGGVALPDHSAAQGGFVRLEDGDGWTLYRLTGTTPEVPRPG